MPIRWLKWRLRKAFWTWLATVKFTAAKVLAIPPPPDEEAPLVPVPFRQAFPEVPLFNYTVADHVPADEVQEEALGFCIIQSRLNVYYSPMQPGLPEVPRNPYDALVEAYTPAFRSCFRAPVRPPGQSPD